MFKNNFHILMTDASDYTVKALLSPLSIKPPSLLSPLSYLDCEFSGSLDGCDDDKIVCIKDVDEDLIID